MRIHWNYGMMVNVFYGCRIQKLTEKNLQISISRLDLTPIMSSGKSVSSFWVVFQGGGSFWFPSRKWTQLGNQDFSGPSTFWSA